MKKHSLMVKLSILFLCATICVLIFLTIIGTDMTRAIKLSSVKNNLYKDATKFLSEYIMEYYDKNNSNYVELVNQIRLLDEMHGTRIWMVSNAGIIVTDSEKDYKINGVAFDLTEENPYFLEKTFQEHVYFPEIMEEPILCTILPVVHKYENKGYLVMSIPVVPIEGNEQNGFIMSCWILFLMVLVILLVYIYQLVEIPIKKITEVTRQFSKGIFKETLELDGTAEFEQLGQSIQEIGDKLKQVDDTQRKFVSNVSHDFRSPLTSIKGYIEAMKDGTIPVEMQGKYLDIIIFETERLIKLTSNLLELNSFEDKGVILFKSSFDINQMIKQIAISFEGTFKKKNLILNLIFSQKEQFVYADMDKIQRVLYNLIDNAIKFSHSDSCVYITTEEKGNKVLIKVTEKGIGIPEDSLDKIWDRFYKTDLSRGKDKKGTGLGLSIVKEIIVAHEEDIFVTSIENVGTEFIFSLSKGDSIIG